MYSKKFRDQAIAILKQQVRQANTAREALKRDDKAGGYFFHIQPANSILKF